MTFGNFLKCQWVHGFLTDPIGTMAPVALAFFRDIPSFTDPYPYGPSAGLACAAAGTAPPASNEAARRDAPITARIMLTS
ncbi:hypothetical protein GCM10010106_45110 [Thermopolyspora flexuosa]|nr:hypothetical protein GCM10010106_45110 [Thermopolyspora flexuosa]